MGPKLSVLLLLASAWQLEKLQCSIYCWPGTKHEVRCESLDVDVTVTTAMWRDRGQESGPRFRFRYAEVLPRSSNETSNDRPLLNTSDERTWPLFLKFWPSGDRRGRRRLSLQEVGSGLDGTVFFPLPLSLSSLIHFYMAQETWNFDQKDCPLLLWNEVADRASEGPFLCCKRERW